MSAVEDVCGECGAPTGLDEDFCGECGAYLDWEERRAAAEPEQPAPRAEEAEASRGIIERVKAAVGVGPAEEPEQPPEPAGPDSPGRSATDATSAPADAVPPDQTAPPPRAPATGADALVVRVPDPAAPSPRQPRAVQPAPSTPRARRRTPAPQGREPLSPGDLVCGECGAGNRPDRKFCRRCGHDLQEAQVAKIPWWSRLRRRPRAVTAGTRPASRSGARNRMPTRLLVLVVMLLALLGAAWWGRGYVVGGWEAVVDRVAGTHKINPVSITASDAQPGHPGSDARDGKSNRYWSPRAPGEGRGSFLEARFERPFRLVHLLVTPGVSAEDEEAFLAHGRPSRLRVVMTRDDGSTKVEDVDLEDKAGLAYFNVATSDVVSVKLEVLRSYGPASAHTAIAEVEFRGRR